MLPRTYILISLLVFFVVTVAANVALYKHYSLGNDTLGNQNVHQASPAEDTASDSVTSTLKDEEKLREAYQSFSERIRIPDTNNYVSSRSPLFKLERTLSSATRPETKSYDDSVHCSLGDVLALTKLDTVTNEYKTVVENLCSLHDVEKLSLSESLKPFWSQDGRYIAFVHEDPDFSFSSAPEVLRFIDTQDIEKGIQQLHLPGVIDFGPYLKIIPNTVRTSAEGHVQMIGVGEWRPTLETYVYVFDFTDWSIKQILDVNPDKNFLLYKEWAEGNAVTVYTVPNDVIKKCEQIIADFTGRIGYEDTGCRTLTFSNFTQMETHTIPF